MDICVPQSRQHFIDRDDLLQKMLRPSDPIFAISEEYPIVLGDDGQEFSLCLYDQDYLIAHLNYWPRTLKNSHQNKEHSIALIGNVVTSPPWQGKGIMRKFFHEVEQRAAAQGIEALILWSDLLQFYQKLGFSSYGHELRITFNCAMLNHHATEKILPIPPDCLELSDLSYLLARRFPVAATIERSPKEFAKLLSIPCTSIFVDESGYALLGKGYDMTGVIHEWGALDEENLLHLLANISATAQMPDLTVLAPPSIPAPFTSLMKNRAGAEVKKHPVAMARILNNEKSVAATLQCSFIWGLDSI